jgi:hypothetical protein
MADKVILGAIMPRRAPRDDRGASRNKSSRKRALRYYGRTVNVRIGYKRVIALPLSPRAYPTVNVSASQFYEADIKIAENQVDTRRIREETSEELKKLAELVSEL